MTDWNDRTDPAVRDRLTRRCSQCKAEPNKFCTNMPISDDRITDRLVHFGR